MRRSTARPCTKRNAPTRAPAAHATAKSARTRVDGGAASGTKDGGTLKKRAGRRRPASEITTVPAITSSHKSWRARAGVPRSASAATSPASTKSAIFASAGAGTKLMSLPRPALGAPHQVAEPIEVRVAQLLLGQLEERGDCARAGSPEERVHHVLERAALGFAVGYGGFVHVARAVAAVAQVALALEVAQHGPHGGISRGIRQLPHHVAHGGAAQPVDDVHDLALAAPQAVVTGWRHERQYAN